MNSLFQSIKMSTGIVFVMMLWLMVFHSHADAASNATDEEALLQFRYSITHDPFHSMANWNSSISYCNWTGVICDLSNTRVVELNLSDKGLSGPISPFLANLSLLTELALPNNSLYGHIPQQLSSLSSLEMMILEQNLLEGPIPPEIGFLTNLQILFLRENVITGSILSSLGNLSALIALDFSYNQLQGFIPPELGMLTQLISLNMDSNILSGTIPSTVGNLTGLRAVSFGNNKFQGSIPKELGKLGQLNTLLLNNNQLSGTIPSSLGNISSLLHLQIFTNSLTGAIPHELGQLIHLQDLHLATNQLAEEIPPSLSNCSSLQNLLLNENQFSGYIPSTFCTNFPHLESLFLSTNKLKGNIYPSLSNCSSLKRLALHENQLSGQIPSVLGDKLIHLENLFLATNQFTGEIPPSLSNCSSLQLLALTENQLSGSIPSDLGFKLIRLEMLQLGANNLTGKIPLSLYNSSSLQQLVLHQNKLTGQIPPLLCEKLPSLSILNLWKNKLSGSIPISIGNCSNLDFIFLNLNHLSGKVPEEIGKLHLLKKVSLYSNILVSESSNPLAFLTALTNCSKLEEVLLSYNQFTGVLPSSIGQLSPNLSWFEVSHNNISGSIPQQITNLSNLNYLDLSYNMLSGSIPSGFRAFKNLERLYLSDNRLQGGIPSDIGEIQNLGLLSLSQNRLSRRIPDSLSSLQELRRLFLHHNRLSGQIPGSLSGCQKLELLDLSYNDLRGSIPGEVFASLKNLQFYSNLSWNALEGFLPREIGKIAMVQAIEISGNKLNGVIPGNIESCTGLKLLNISRNALKGPIPEAISNLQDLMDLDLSSNALSGPVPKSLKKLKFLRYLNLSFNRFIGEIPKDGVSSNATATVLLFGNPDLCGPQIFLLPACPSQKSHSQVKKVIVAVFSCIAFVACCLLLGFLWRCNSKRVDPPLAILQKLEHLKLSYEDLFSATDGFNESRLVGLGNFGSVYRGDLRDGRVVAMKVLNLQNEEAQKSFHAECKVLRKVRHRNLTKILTSCSIPEFKALVFEFMSNGSLEKHLYSPRNNYELGFKRRLDIAIDIAHAMEYLHYNSSVQVIHCDLKPENVLLDEDMIAHVTDFGIARLTCSSQSTGPLTSTLAIKGSVGYIAPEYGLGGKASREGDVYSYGILLLEMMTKKRPTNDMFLGDLTLHKWVNSAFPNNLMDVLDQSLLQDIVGMEGEGLYRQCLASTVGVGIACSKDSPEERPSMKDVVRMLEGMRESLTRNTRASGRAWPSISDLVSNPRREASKTDGVSDSDSESSSTH